MHHPLAFLADVRHMRKQRACLEKARERECQEPWQADAKTSQIASCITTWSVKVAILSERIRAGDL